MTKTRTNKSGGAARALRAVFILLVIGCAGLAAYLFFVYPETGPDPEEPLTFAAGVYVENIHLAGRTADQARQALSVIERELTQDIYFQMDTAEKSVTLTHADMRLTFDTETVLAQALQLGNAGTRGERQEIRAQLLESPQYFTITCTVDVTPAREKVREIAALSYKEPVNASVELDMQRQDFFVFTEGERGEALDEEALMVTLRQRALQNDFGQVTLPIVHTEPAISIDDIKNTITLRAHAETSFKKSPYNREDRVYNVKKAAGFMNGFVLKPGEVFSTNDTLGPRTYELGWKPAPAYVNGATEDQAGGGVCQVSSTLYNAVVKADLEIVYRRNHSSTVAYVKHGLDATINTGTIDFTFKNNTGSDIYIFAYTFDSADGQVPEGKDDKTIHVDIYGEAFPENYDSIELTSERIEKLLPSGEMEVVVDNTAAWDFYSEEVARRDGAVWQSYKHYYKDGVEVASEPLAKSTYRAFAGRIVVGPGYYSAAQPQPVSLE
ncbi:MAG: VanW family protein [Clostridiales bacterium]|jgi:vancomycin resistance protein YoaR|nr:VanW family protein [Clostridiales bacterium]